jgi:hypothetical protein
MQPSFWGKSALTTEQQSQQLHALDFAQGLVQLAQFIGTGFSDR